MSDKQFHDVLSIFMNSLIVFYMVVFVFLMSYIVTAIIFNKKNRL